MDHNQTNSLQSTQTTRHMFLFKQMSSQNFLVHNCNIDRNIMIVVSILDNSITHAHTYVIMLLCVPVATHGYLLSIGITTDLNS